jgi:gliding motility-associated-like protein
MFRSLCLVWVCATFLTNISAQINYSYIPREYVDFRVSTSGLSNANPYTICKGLQNDGGYFVTGLVRRSNQNDLFLNHLKKNDSIDWTLNIQTDGNEGGEIIDLVPISNSELILSSETYSSKTKTNTTSLHKINSNGSALSSITFDPSNSQSNSGLSTNIKHINTTSDGKICVVGSDAQLEGNSRVWVSLLNSNLSHIYTTTIDFGNNTQVAYDAKSINYDNKKCIIICGRVGNQPMLAIIEEQNGKVLKSWVGSNNRTLFFTELMINPKNSKEIFLTGYSNLNFRTNVAIAKFSIDTEKFQKIGNIGTFRTEYVNNLEIGTDEQLILTSQTSYFFRRDRTFVHIFDLNLNLKESWVAYQGNNRDFESARYNSNHFTNKGIKIFGIDNSTNQTHINILNSTLRSNSCSVIKQSNGISFYNNSVSMTPKSVTDSVSAANPWKNLSVNTQSISWNRNSPCYIECPLPINPVDDTLFVCKKGNPLQVDVTQDDNRDVTYSWSNGSTSPILNVVKPGIYTIEITNPCGVLVDTITVIEDDVPLAPGFRDTLFCTSNWVYKLELEDQNRKYIWNNGSTQGYRTFYNEPGVYWVETINSCGRRTDTLKLIQGNLPLAQNYNDTFICNNTGSILDYNIQSEPFVTYKWWDGSTSQSKKINIPNMYWLEASNKCGMTFDSFEVVTRSIPMNISNTDTIICNGSPFNFIINSEQPFCNYLWSDGDTSSQRVFSDTFGTWDLEISNVCGSVNNTITITRDSLPTKILDSAVWFCRGDTYVLKGHQPRIGNFNYLWNNGQRSPEINVVRTESLSLTTSNICGSITEKCKVYAEICPCHFYIPNSFSPNSDGINDELIGVSDCEIAKGTWSIFTRWGQCIFRNRPISEAWNGTYEGKELPEGLYIYQIYGNFDLSIAASRTIQENGVVMLIRKKN